VPNKCAVGRCCTMNCGSALGASCERASKWQGRTNEPGSAGAGTEQLAGLETCTA
jgi:hypothetical protein